MIMSINIEGEHSDSFHYPWSQLSEIIEIALEAK